MNKEDFVPLEVAKLLKEKGFDEFCSACYYKEELCPIKSWNQADMLEGKFFAAPKLYEAVKWLRNKHKLHIDVGMCGDYSTDADGNKVGEWDFWTFDMYYTTNFKNHIYDCFGEYDTYEEALNAGIYEALKMI